MKTAFPDLLVAPDDYREGSNISRGACPAKISIPQRDQSAEGPAGIPVLRGHGEKPAELVPGPFALLQYSAGEYASIRGYIKRLKLEKSGRWEGN